MPAEELDEFNRHIIGPIAVVDAYFGPGFTGYIPERPAMKDKTAITQFILLGNLLDNSSADFEHEMPTNHTASKTSDTQAE